MARIYRFPNTPNSEKQVRIGGTVYHVSPNRDNVAATDGMDRLFNLAGAFATTHLRDFISGCRNLGYVNGNWVYQLQDGDTSSSDVEANFGILNEAGRENRRAAAIRAFV